MVKFLGGSKGIGKALAKALVKRGCSVTVAARTPLFLEKLCDELNEYAEEHKLDAVAKYVTCDFTDGYEAVSFAWCTKNFTNLNYQQSFWSFQRCSRALLWKAS